MAKWTQQELDTLTELYPKSSTLDIMLSIPNRTASAIKGKAKTLGIRKAKKPRIFSDEEIKFIKENYTSKENSEIASVLNCSISAISRVASRCGLKKSKSFFVEQGKRMIDNGRATRFKLGQIPPNKGKKQKEYMNAESIANTVATRFAKGNKPVNYRAIGSERITVDGYIEIKAVDGLHGWRLKHRILWIEKNGKIPKGYNIQFKYRNPLNCCIENLYIISRQEQLAKENGIYRYPEELRQLIRLNGKVKRNIKKVKDENNNE